MRLCRIKCLLSIAACSGLGQTEGVFDFGKSRISPVRVAVTLDPLDYFFASGQYRLKGWAGHGLGGSALDCWNATDPVRGCESDQGPDDHIKTKTKPEKPQPSHRFLPYA